MVTKQELDRALGDAEVGKKFRFVFCDARAESAAIMLRSVLALNVGGVICFEKWADPLIILFAAQEGRWDRENRTFTATIGPNFHNFSRAQFELILLGCLERIEAV